MAFPSGVRRKGVSRWRRALPRAAGLAAAGIVLGCAWGASRAAWRLPDVGGLASQAPARTSYMALRPGGAVAQPLAPVSPLLACAVVKAEDRGFFRHDGFERGQVMRGVRRTLSGGGVAGGSTITQQLARNLYLTPERTPARKLREAMIARRLERSLSKERILALYLGLIEWGDGVWGADAAARHYFGVPAREVDAFQATFLASLIPAPRAPLAGANRLRAERVQRRVLAQLHASGLLDDRAWTEAWARTGEVHRALAAGVPMRDALATPPLAGGRPVPPPVRRDARPLPAARAVAEGCGLHREQREETLRGPGGR
jgi:monofunctional biosynthetic peptidoglycan transglycosylase